MRSEPRPGLARAVAVIFALAMVLAARGGAGAASLEPFFGTFVGVA